MAPEREEVISLQLPRRHQRCAGEHSPINLTSHIAEQTHVMYSLYRGSTDLHNEATKSRQKRDNDDESSLMSNFLGFSVFLSVSHPATLQNLVTKDLATEVIQESLLRAKVWTARGQDIRSGQVDRG